MKNTISICVVTAVFCLISVSALAEEQTNIDQSVAVKTRDNSQSNESQSEVAASTSTTTTTATDGSAEKTSTEKADDEKQHDLSAIKTLYEVDSTLDSVLKALVAQQFLTQEQADQIRKNAVEQAQKRIEAQSKPEVIEEPPPSKTEKVIRVPYVPEYVKQQIRDDVSNRLREATVDAVLAQAEQERWGVPGSTPEWVDRIKWKGDIRLRAEWDEFDQGNQPYSYPNYQKINEEGGFVSAGPQFNLNTTVDRERLRLRARLAMDATVTQGMKASFRIATGNITDPVSTNQTLGNYGNKFSIVWDRAYFKYDDLDLDGFDYLTIKGGRMPNPWYSTDLVWDTDVAFEGLAATYRFNLRGADSLLNMTQNDRLLMFTLGAFPLQEVQLSPDDKWLYGGQIHSKFIFENQSTFNLAAAYYYYSHITGKINKVGDDTLDYTAPRYVQKGNTLFNIRNDPYQASELYALASDYKLVDINFGYDFASMAPYHVVLNLDYVKNIGFDKQQIEGRLQGRTPTTQQYDANGNPVGDPLKARTTGYMAKVTFGWPKVTWPWNWNVMLAYKYLERDAVLDAFTDSDFHLGGTDAKGYIIGAKVGLMENAWLQMRYLSAEAIDGPKFGVDVIQIDINAIF